MLNEAAENWTKEAKDATSVLSTYNKYFFSKSDMVEFTNTNSELSYINDRDVCQYLYKWLGMQRDQVY